MIKLDRLEIVILIICAVVVAYYFIGDIALAGLLGIFFKRGKKHEQKAKQLNDEANEHIAMADKDVQAAVEKQKEADKIQNEIEDIVESKPDESEPIKKVVDDAKKDW